MATRSGGLEQLGSEDTTIQEKPGGLPADSPSPLERFLRPDAMAGRPGELRLLVPVEKRVRKAGAHEIVEVRANWPPGDCWLRVAPTVEEAVVDSAIARSDRLLVTFESGDWQVIGGLHTRAIPGRDAMETVELRARTIRLEATERLALVSGASQVLLRARGSVETLARHITHRASEVQKIIGRMLHLN